MRNFLFNLETGKMEENDCIFGLQNTRTSVTSVSTSDVSLTDESVITNTTQTSDHTTTVEEFTRYYHSITTGASQKPDSSTPLDGIQTSDYKTINIETTTKGLQPSSHEKDEAQGRVLCFMLLFRISELKLMNFKFQRFCSKSRKRVRRYKIVNARTENVLNEQ